MQNIKINFSTILKSNGIVSESLGNKTIGTMVGITIVVCPFCPTLVAELDVVLLVEKPKTVYIKYCPLIQIIEYSTHSGINISTVCSSIITEYAVTIDTVVPGIVPNLAVIVEVFADTDNVVSHCL